MKLTVWLDSGANHSSCRKETVDIADLNISVEEWRNFSEEEKEQIAKELAFCQADWGFKEED